MKLSTRLVAVFKSIRTQIKDLKKFKILSPLINSLQNFYLVFRFIGDYRETRRYLKGEWGSLHPICIPLESCNEIVFPQNEGWFIYNPTLIWVESRLRFFARITNAANAPEVNIFGSLKKRAAIDDTYNGIVEFGLGVDNKLIDFKIVVEPISVPNFEDPKAFLLGDEVALFCNEVKKEPKGDDRTFICQNAIINLKSKSITHLASPYSKNIEKNWIPIDLKNHILRMIYSSSPLTLLNINLQSGLTSVSVLDEESRFDLHGGSQIVRLTDKMLVRVARRKMQMKKLGMITISYLVFHDNDLNIVRISKPFLFRKFGFEICNGLARIDDQLVFTWGEDDIRNFIGRIKLNDMLDWAFDEDLQPH